MDDLAMYSRTLADLIAVRELLSDPKHWTKDYYRRADKTGEWSYCLAGAINEVVGGYGHTAQLIPDIDIRLGCVSQFLKSELANDPKLREKSSVRHGGGQELISITEFNDNSEHADVLAMLDSAIATLEVIVGWKKAMDAHPEVSV